MKCFNHHQSDAIGICKACCKGICAECATDVGGGLACTATCIGAVQQITALVRANAAASSIGRGRVAYLWPAFLVVMGVLFAVTPFLSEDPPRSPMFAVALGSVFVLFGVLLGAYQHLWRKKL